MRKLLYDESACKPGYVCTIIYLVFPSPESSSDLPRNTTGRCVVPCAVLLRMGFTYAPSVTRGAVVS